MTSSFFSIQKNFLEFEKNKQLFDLRLYDVPFWEYVRVYAYNHILHQKGVAARPEQKSKRDLFRDAKRTVGEISGALSWMLKSSVAKKQAPIDVIFFIIDTRRETLALQYVEILSKKYSVAVVDPSTFSEQTRSVFPCPTVNWRGVMQMARMKARFHQFEEKEASLLSHVEKQINSEFGVSVDLTSLTRDLFLTQYFTLPALEKLFRKFSPKVVGLINDGRKIGIMMAAHRAGIPVFEVQHGNVSPLDLTWSYSTSEVRPQGLPDYVLTFGEYWNQKHNLPSQMMAVGFPHYDRERLGIERSGSITAKDPKSILVISVMDEALIQLTIDLSKKLPDYTIYFKLRSDEYGRWRDVYPLEFQSLKNVIVVEGSEPSLYSLLKKVSAQITSSSTVIYEGLAFGLKTFVYKGFRYEDCLDLVEEDRAWLVESASQVAEVLKSGALPSRPLETEKVFRSHCEQNIPVAIKSIMEKGRVYGF